MPFYGTKSYAKRGNDVYLTPESAIDQLLFVEPFEGHVLEPACGDGRIVNKLKQLHYIKKVTAFDISEVVPEGCLGGINFLQKGVIWSCDHVITNPPYRYAEHFVDKALQCADGKVAMLLRLAFLEGQSRKEKFRKWPLKAVYVFSKRLTFKMGGRGTMAYAWFVWDNFWTQEPVIRWL